ncbi:peptidoglycan-binding protein [Methanosphaera sp. ISO3-F5]|uniref:peptidoglycan-binding domain-containing protein n=1 Tax=Methanosphaera sp. ISO3-F5 TaxID=1452353 RepID=UPI002B25A798|nr:peptidoglycan-binding protein [Methanosphaera sp. ISO3-F5]WQH64110.1 peptidoglycan-binding protein [Methanosphaera sp. ISO3-F5]
MTFDCSKIKLKNGSSGTEVKELQELLRGYGCYEGSIDGKFDSVTSNAVKEYQRILGLTVDGWVGSETCKSLHQYQSLSQDLKKGSNNVYVKLVQNRLKQLGYYTGTVDGLYGTLTFNSVKQYQAKHNLLQDGVVGKVTYKSLLTNQNTNSGTNNNRSTTSNGIYTNTHLCERRGGDCGGQITGYHCACFSIQQGIRTFGITGYSQRTIGGYAGTTTAGTGHWGIETALAKIAKNEGIKLKVTWKNLSDLGSTQKEQYKKIGEIISSPNKFAFIHLLYRNRYGHYEHIKTVNTNTSGLIIRNSLGDKCNSPAYCGYNESRTMSTETSYIRGISQKSVCIVEKI